MSYADSSLAWTKHRQSDEFGWLRHCSSVAQQQALRHLQTAFENFFSKRANYPRFRSKKGNQSVQYSVKGFKFDRDKQTLAISKVGRLRVKWSRGFTSMPTTVTITKDCAGRYFVSLCLDEPAKDALPKTGNKVGIDLGISRLATLSNGERIANPRHTVKNAAKLCRLQRVLSRRIIGSNRWRLQKIKVARHHAHIADSRKDYMDKLTTDLVRRFDVLAIEDLNVLGMIGNRKLAKHISCSSFGMFKQMLTYKCAWYGRELRVVDRFFPSSKRCSACGHIHDKMPLDVREFDCVECGQHHDRDENAAKNILAAGHAVTARGCRVSRAKVTALACSGSRTVNQPALS